MRRTHAKMPLTRQEEAARDYLIDARLSFESHHVFELDGSSSQKGISVDFLVFTGSGVAIECTVCGRKKGSALSEVRRRSAFMDYRFGLLKGSFPRLTCGALVEAPNEDQDHLSQELIPILRRSDFIASSIEELGRGLSSLGGKR